MYGRSQTSIEQINNTTGVTTYLHHDQQGSTRLLTGSAGTVTGSTTFNAYGSKTGWTRTSTTQLGYDTQYTSSDTGLIYLRNRVYDPATAQFLTVDPLEAITGAPYSYTRDNPGNSADPTGLCNADPISESFWTEGNCVSESPLNPIHYYEKEVESYENGCGYFASVLMVWRGRSQAPPCLPEGRARMRWARGSGSLRAQPGISSVMRRAISLRTRQRNRALIESVVESKNYVRTASEGDVLYRETLPDGTQAWAKVFNGAITNGGLEPGAIPLSEGVSVR